MTKNFTYFMFLVASVSLVFTSCKPEVDVAGSCKDVAIATMIGTDSVRSGCLVSGLTMKVVDYRFLPDNKAVRTETTFGDGTYAAPVSMNLSYAAAEYGESNVGLMILFTPEDSSIEPFEVKFVDNAIVENGTDTLTDQMAKVENFNRILTTFPNSTWEYTDMSYYIDTIKYDSVKVTINRIVTPSGIIRDTIYDTIHIELFDTVGVHQYTAATISFNRDANTLANIGHYKYDYTVHTKGDSITPSQLIDSLCVHKDYDMRWNFTSIITARQFNLVTVAEDESKERLNFNMFRYTAGTNVIVNSNYTYTYKE